VTIEALAIGADEDRSLTAFPNREVDGTRGAQRERDDDNLATLAHDGQRAVAALETERFNVGAAGFGGPQPDERLIASTREPGGHQQGADFVAVEAGGMGLVVEARSPNMDGRGGCDEPFFFGVAVEARNRAQPPRDRRPRSTESLEMPAKRFDVGAARTEQANLVLGAPGDVLTQIERVRLADESAVAGQEADQRGLLLRTEQRVAYRDGRRRVLSPYRYVQHPAETREPRPTTSPSTI
jgi:hypothetical protein